MPESKPLTNRQKKFVSLYLGEANGNAALAAREAGYSRDDPDNARKIAFKLLRKPEIREAIDRALEETACSTGEILGRLSAIVRGSIDQLGGCFVEKDGRRILDLKKAQQAGVGHLIEAIVPTKFGDSVKLYSAQRAAETLGRYRSLWQDNLRVEATWPREAIDSLSKDELAIVANGKLTPAIEAKLAMFGTPRALPAPAVEGEVVDVEVVE